MNITRDFTALNTSITNEEEAIRGNNSANLNNIRSDKGSYDLSRPPLLDVDDDSDLHRAADGSYQEIKIDRILVREITGTYMPKIAGELATARTENDKTSDLGGLYRDWSIGVGSNGPSSELSELRFLLDELLANLGEEATYSAKSLQLAVDDIGLEDSAAKDALEKHETTSEKKIGTAGGPNDPWS